LDDHFFDVKDGYFDPDLRSGEGGVDTGKGWGGEEVVV
jgi:hypothetical protein